MLDVSRNIYQHQFNFQLDIISSEDTAIIKHFKRIFISCLYKFQIMNEWLLILAAIIGFWILRTYLSKLISPKINLIISFVCFVALMIVFIKNLVAHFTYPLLIVLIILFIATLIDLYKRYIRIQTSSK